MRRITKQAIAGEFSHATITAAFEDGTSRTLDLSVRPVRDEAETIVSIIVEGVDVTERISLERELREVEELHTGSRSTT